MLKSEAAAYLAGVTQTEGAEASAPTNLHVITGEVGEMSEDGKARIKIEGLVFSESNDQYIEVDALGGLEEGDIATLILSGEQGHAMTPLAIGSIGSIDRITVRIAAIEADYIKVQQLDAAEARIGELEADHVSVDDLDAATARIGTLETTRATVTDLEAATARIHSLEVDHVSIDDFEAEQANIDQLQADTADIGTIRANSAKVQNLTAAQLEADHATVGSLDTTYATIANLNAANGRITNLESTKANISDLEADYITADEIEATYMHANMSNSDVAWIENGTIKNGAIVSAMINDVSANKLTAGTINGSVINVTNLNADNITTGTINGQRIGEGSLSLSKLEDDVYTESEVDAKLATMQAEIDGAIETWTGTAVPTLNNSPASNWKTAAVRDTHVGDVYFVVNSQSQQNGYNYRFTKSGSTYSWQLIKDSDVTNALQRLETAEGKITTFDSDISTLKTDTGSLTTRTTNLETRMSDAEDDILDKVDTTTFNEVSDTVDQHSQTISQHTTAISNKADSSTVTAVTNRVSKNEQDISGINTTIGELQDTVETKADGSTVTTISNKLNTVSDTVDGHTQTLTSVQNTLSTKADSSTVTTLSNTVNTVKQTADTNASNISSLQTTVSGHTTTISQHTTAIQQNTDAIALRATKTEVQQVRPAYANSSTAAGTAAKVATIDPAVTGYALYKGATVSVTFSTANTASTPTLNLNSTGAKQIRSYTGAALSEAEYKWAAGATIDLVYDGSYWRMQDGGSVKRVTAAEASIRVNADNIESKVSKDGVISSINQSAETVKIQASKVEIDGTAVFSAISSDVDDAITSKGYATTGQVSSAKSEAISSANSATDTKLASYSTTAQANNLYDAKGAAAAVETNSGNLFLGASMADRSTFINNASTDFSRHFRYYNGSASIHSFSEYSPGVYQDTVTLNNSGNLGIAFARMADEMGLDSTSSYTITCWAKCSKAGMNLAIGLSYYNTSNSWVWRGGTNATAFSAADTWQKFSLTFKPDADTKAICYCFTVAGGTGSETFTIRNCWLEKNSAYDAQTTANNAVKRTQRIWYRKSASGAPATPGTASSNWVTKADDGNDAWTKMHIAISSTHKYIYTCEQYEMANGTVGYTSVLLDNTITVIDGGNIITGSVKANTLDAADINASKTLTVGAMTDAAASTILNSNIQVGGKNIASDIKLWYGRTSSGYVAQGVTVTKIDNGLYKAVGTTTQAGDIWWMSSPIENKLSSDAGQYTMSITIEKGTWPSANFYLQLAEYGSSWHANIKTANGETSKTFTCASGYYPRHFGFYSGASGISIDIEFRIKLEKGNKATDWTPAPEDQTVYVVDAVRVGGRNYLLNTENPSTSNPPKPIGDGITWGGVKNMTLSFTDGIMKLTSTSDVSTDEHYVRLNAPSHTQRVFEAMGVEPHDELVLSGYIRATMASSNSWVTVRIQPDTGSSWLNTITLRNLLTGEESTNTSNVPILSTSSTSWVRFAVRASIPESVAAVSAYFSFQQYGTFTVGDTIEFKRLKLEKGNKATDWTPAPEDQTAYVDDSVSSIQVGGRNLATGTANSTDFTCGSAVTYFAPIGFYPTSDIGLSLLKDTSNKSFTLSFDWSTKDVTAAYNMFPSFKYTSTSYVSLTGTPMISVPTGTASGHYEYTFEPTSAQRTYGTMWLLSKNNTNTTQCGTVTISNFMFECSNKASTWTPAPEDMATAESLAGTNESLEDAITDIGELSDQLAGTVSEQNKTITDIQTYLNSIRKDLDAEIQSRQQWLNFNSAEGLVIGATGSTFKTVTTNTSQQFRSGGTVLAETSGTEFVAPVMRSDQLLIGNWMWTRRDNGNLSLKWIG